MDATPRSALERPQKSLDLAYVVSIAPSMSPEKSLCHGSEKDFVIHSFKRTLEI